MRETQDQEPSAPSPSPDGLESIIEKISTEHGFDIRGYKRSTLHRRILKRMADVRCAGVGDYLTRLDRESDESARLIETLLINVTEFFRDPPSWECLQQQCLEPLCRSQGAEAPIRAWSVGCASGEEAYSLAICFIELLGEAAARRVRIYATDVDEGALAAARSGTYRPEDLRNVSAERLERFFERPPGGGRRIRREVRSLTVFGRHNALADPPLSRLDLIVCRNLLIYFDSETQRALVERFHSALREDRFLFLGKAETLVTRSVLFHPVESRYRILRRISPGDPTAFGI